MRMIKDEVEAAELINSKISLEALIDNFIDSCPFQKNKSTKTAELLSALAENEENRTK